MLVPFARQSGRILSLAATMCAVLPTAGWARDWLDLRRSGAAAILADARRSAAPEPWQAEYVAMLPADHPLSQGKPVELRLVVVRLPALEAKAGGKHSSPRDLKPGQAPLLSRMMIRFDGPAQLKGSGVLSDGKQLWVKLPTGKAVLATPALLNTALPGLQLPLQVFALPEVSGEYTYEIEGEFGDSGVIRCRPSYTATPGVLPGKIGVHKRWGTWTLVESDDRDGKRLALAEWLDVEDRNNTPVPQSLRLRPLSGDAGSVMLMRRKAVVGRAAETALSPKLLR